mgnify:CR=1 FL=1
MSPASLSRAAALPASVRGPVERRAFARFAGGCLLCTTVEAELAALNAWIERSVRLADPAVSMKAVAAPASPASWIAMTCLSRSRTAS